METPLPLTWKKCEKTNSLRGNKIITPPTREENLPEWLTTFEHLDSGTVVIWESLDRLTWTSISGLSDNLTKHFGVTYRNFLSSTKIYVGGTFVEPIDPLFITPGFRYYDYDEQTAMALEPLRIPVKIEGADEKAIITVRGICASVWFWLRRKEQGRYQEKPKSSLANYE